jgi:hypothetical protein
MTNFASILGRFTALAAPVLAHDFLDACRGAGIAVHEVPDGGYRPLSASSSKDLQIILPGTCSNIAVMGASAAIVVADGRRPFLGTAMGGAHIVVFGPPNYGGEPPVFPVPNPGFSFRLLIQAGATMTLTHSARFQGALTVAGTFSSLNRGKATNGGRTARKAVGQAEDEGGVATKTLRASRVHWIRPSSFGVLKLLEGSLKPGLLHLEAGAMVHYRETTYAADVGPLTKGVLYAGTQGVVEPYGLAFVKAGAEALCDPTSMVIAEEGARVTFDTDAAPANFTLDIPKCGGVHKVMWAKAGLTSPGTRKKRKLAAGRVHYVTKILVDGEPRPEGLTSGQRCIRPEDVGIIFHAVLTRPGPKAKPDPGGAPPPPREDADPAAARPPGPPREDTDPAAARPPGPPRAETEPESGTVTPTTPMVPPTLRLPAGLPELPRGGLPPAPPQTGGLPPTEGGRSLTLMVEGGHGYVLVKGGWKPVPLRVRISVNPADAAASLLAGGQEVVPATVTFFPPEG